MVRALLDAHAIEASLTSDAARAVFPLSVDGLGEVRLTVCGDDADRAAQVIASYRDDQARGMQPGPAEFAALEAAIGHRFRDRGLLEHALTHRSRAHEDVTGGVSDNESLEFLGDAVLGFIVADLLFHRYPDRDEGRKSKMKAGLVSTAALSVQAMRLDLGRYLLLGRGEERSGGRRKQTLLADTYEALIAAVYLDGGVEAARVFIARQLADLIDRAGDLAIVGDDFKSALQERLQAQGRPLPDYAVTDEQGPAHRRLFQVDVSVTGTVVARGEGRTKKEAEQDAARRALVALDD